MSSVRHWLENVHDPPNAHQLKTLLLIDGPVKSGKTSFAKYILPEYIHEIRADVSQPQIRLQGLKDAAFAHTFLDLSILRGQVTSAEKWRQLDELLHRELPDLWPKPDESRGFHEVLNSLRNLNSAEPKFWAMVWDEWHFFFEGLPKNESDHVAEQLKTLLLDGQSNVHFVLAGSTQASFWWSLQQARVNGMNMLLNASIVTMPFSSTDEDVKACLATLQSHCSCSSELAEELKNVCQDQTVPSLVQVFRNSEAHAECSVRDAFQKFLSSKAAVYWRDFDALPESFETKSSESKSFPFWAEGSVTAPPEAMSHLFEQKGNLHFFADKFFCSFLSTYFDPEQGKLVRFQSSIPWADILLLQPLIPIAYHQYLLNDREDEGKKLCKDFNGLYQYLISQPKNSGEKAKNNSPTMCRALSLFRNILAHERSVKWQDLKQLVENASKHMGGRDQLRKLVQFYQDAVVVKSSDRG